MKVILVTGLDGSGKSTFFNRVESGDHEFTGIIHVPHIRPADYASYPEIVNAATFINNLSLEADHFKQPSLKALSIFSAMLLFRELLAVKKKEGCRTVFCERHPLIDTPAYSSFYSVLTDPTRTDRAVLQTIDEKYSTALKFLHSLLPEGLLSDSGSSSFLNFIYHEFGQQRLDSDSDLKFIFGTGYPDKIYFLDAEPNILVQRLAGRSRTEAHENTKVLTQLRDEYRNVLRDILARKHSPVEIIDANDFNNLDRFTEQLVSEIVTGHQYTEYPALPGRGLVNATAVKLRHDFLSGLGIAHRNLATHSFDYGDIQNKIESVIGAVEVPVGLVGPLRFNNNGHPEMVYCAAATLEGALVASMNRGAKAVSMSGGFHSEFIHQKMTRCPLFILQNDKEANTFATWVSSQLNALRAVTQQYSNHAQLISLDTLQTGDSVHVTFTYTTGDASGQNMTTTCTWYGMLWIVEQFFSETGIQIEHFVIEGNGSSDKKVSLRSAQGNRGCSVVAECELEETVIRKILRTTSDDIFRCYAPSVEAAKTFGMVGYNINVANAIAAIFLATGQDMASVHESSTAFLSLKKTSRGLHLELRLPSLVIGTIGGGTGLPKQKEALDMMGCSGAGNIQRFGRLIAGFALSLEISTYAAIVSGEFAKAHEKLGRNKPVNWLVKGDLTPLFIRTCLHDKISFEPSDKISFATDTTENGIITTLTSRATKKLTGFIPFEITSASGIHRKKVLIKSKPLDMDVIKGLHLMAASIDPVLSDLIYKYRNDLEYKNTHLKEIALFRFLDEHHVDSIPEFYGSYCDEKREAYLLFEEFLTDDELLLINSENKPALWTDELIEDAIRSITTIHQLLAVPASEQKTGNISEFTASRARGLYTKLLEIIRTEEEQPELQNRFGTMHDLLNLVCAHEAPQWLPRTIIHNDFNPRNVAVRRNGKCCIYDWELAMRNVPHRDIVEFLAFTLPENFEPALLKRWLEFHHRQYETSLSFAQWLPGYEYALAEFMVCRMSFYKAAGILMKLKFTDRVMKTSFRMLDSIRVMMVAHPAEQC